VPGQYKVLPEVRVICKMVLNLSGRKKMARDPGLGYRIVAEVIGVKGECSAGHYVGETFEISCHDPAGLCGFFYHDIFPSLATLQFGGSMPWWEKDEVVLRCPDPQNEVTLRLKRIKRA